MPDNRLALSFEIAITQSTYFFIFLKITFLPYLKESLAKGSLTCKTTFLFLLNMVRMLF